MTGPQIEAYFKELATHVFGFDITAFNEQAGRPLLGTSFGKKTGISTALFGNVPQQLLDVLAIKSLRVKNAVAGFQASAKDVFLKRDLSAAEVEMVNAIPSDYDLLMISDELLDGPTSVLKATIFHEGVHQYEQTKQTSLKIIPNFGRDLRDSLTLPGFREYHSNQFFDIAATAAPILAAFDEYFSDALDVLSNAFHHDYYGNEKDMRDLVRHASKYHAVRGNKADRYTAEYLPKIDAFYRYEVAQKRILPVLDKYIVCDRQYKRQCYVLSEETFALVNANVRGSRKRRK